jgi:uncharacterized C2H2 Zn-finger protein
MRDTISGHDKDRKRAEDDMGPTISKSSAASYSDNNNNNRLHGTNRATADFQCFVCGAIFTTDQDRKQHLEKESHGVLRAESDKEDEEIARQQEELNESHFHHI